MSWTNADLKKVFDQYKEAICHIGLNNGKSIFFNFPGRPDGVKVSDVTFETIGQTEVMKIAHQNTKQTPHYKFFSYVTTDLVESVEIMEKGYEKYRIDAWMLN